MQQRSGDWDLPLTAVWTGKSFAYILWPNQQTARGGGAPHASPVLIDAGSDPNAQAIQRVLAARGKTLEDVASVLLTHGHRDHVAGLVHMPHAQIFVAKEDGSLARGDAAPKNVWRKISQRMRAQQSLPRALNFVVAGQQLVMAGHTVTACALPGHTQGSMAYAVAGGLVAGDSIEAPSLCSTHLEILAPWAADNPTLARDVLARVHRESLTFLADGHTGITRLSDCKETPPQPSAAAPRRRLCARP